MEVEVHAGKAGKAGKTAQYINLCFQKLTGSLFSNKVYETNGHLKQSKGKLYSIYSIFLFFTLYLLLLGLSPGVDIGSLPGL